MTPRYKTTRVTKHGQALRDAISASAATPEGFAVAMLKPEHSTNTIHNAVDWMVKHGLVFKARVSQLDVRFFTSPATAETYVLTRTKPSDLTIVKDKAQRFGKEAEVVYPAGYKHTVHPTPAPRNQAFTHGFVHSGVGAMR